MGTGRLGQAVPAGFVGSAPCWRSYLAVAVLFGSPTEIGIAIEVERLWRSHVVVRGLERELGIWLVRLGVEAAIEVAVRAEPQLVRR